MACKNETEVKDQKERSTRRKTRAAKELEDLIEDNKGRSEADKVAVWRKIEQALANNDAVVTELVFFLLIIGFNLSLFTD